MKSALLISISLNILTLGIFGGKRIYYQQSGLPKPTTSYFDDWNTMRTSLFETQKIDTDDVVFIGTSLTEGFPVTEIFGCEYKNRGIGGNTTSHILNRISGIVNSRPKKIFLEAGTNDIINGLPVDSIFNNYSKIIELISREQHSILYIQSVLPLGRALGRLNDSVDLLNSRLIQLCAGRALAYVDLHSPMSLQGRLDSTLTEDGIHLNAKGYAIWESEITPLIK